MSALQAHHSSSQKPSEEIFYDPSIKERFFDTADRMRKEEILTDVILVTDSGKLPAHKFILAANSDYFLTLFNGPLATTEVNINLHSVSQDVLQDVLSYIYTGLIRITEKNIEDVLYIACMLLLTNLRDRCAKFLKNRLHLENCLQIFSIAKKFSLQTLTEVSLNFIAVTFMDLSTMHEFLELSLDELTDIVSLENLAIRSEDHVMEKAIMWLEHDVFEREEKFLLVLECIHLPSVGDALIKNILDTNCTIRKNKELVSAFQTALKMRNQLEVSDSFMESTHPLACYNPRKYMRCVPCIIAMGGPTLSLFNSELDKWCEIIKCKPRHCPGMDVIGSYIYIVGGSLEWKRKSSGEKYDTETNEWLPIESMSTTRSNFGLVEHKEKLYALGGYDGDFPLSSAEVYDPKNDKWTRIANMNSSRDGACNVSDGEHLYAIGGYDGKRYLTSTERYSIETGLWNDKVVPPMTEKRQNAMSAYYDDHIFIIGGYFDDTYHQSVEVFNVSDGDWRFVSPLPEPRHHAGAAAMNGNVFVCGGWSGQLPVTSVDVYSIEDDVWRKAAPMLTPSMVRCAAVNFPRKSMLRLFPPSDEDVVKRRSRKSTSSTSDSFASSIELSSSI